MAANPNTMTFKQVFSAEYQMSHYRQPIYQVLAEVSLAAGLQKGQIVNRSYASDVMVNDMGADGSYATQALTDTQESLTVNKEKEASFYIKNLDELQAHLPVKMKYSRKLVNALITQIDGDVLNAAVAGASTTLDDGTLGGTATNGLTVTPANVANMFSAALGQLRRNSVIYSQRFNGGEKMNMEIPDGMPLAIVPPDVVGLIELWLGGKNTQLGDTVSRNGYEGYLFGFNIFMSNSLPWNAILGIATTPTDGDTVTINGVTFTFKTALGAVAGQVLIGGSAAAANTNLATLVNAPTVTTANGIAFTAAASIRLLKNISATAQATSTTFASAGWGNIIVSKVLTAGGDGFTAGKQKLFALFGLSKSISLVVQKDPSITERPSPTARIGVDIIAWCNYGFKVFTDQAPQLVAFALNASTFGAVNNTPK